MSHQGVTPPAEAVLKPSSKLFCEKMTPVKEYDFEDESSQPKLDYAQLLAAFAGAGYQASHLAEAFDIVNRVLRERADTGFIPDQQIEDEFIRPKKACTLFLAYDSETISNGMQENICFLARNKMVDCIVTNSRAIEEDLIKCFELDNVKSRRANTDVNNLRLPESSLRENGTSCIGNDNYIRMRDWFMSLLDKMLEEQKNKDQVWTPSKLNERLGLEIDNPDSFCYQAAKNKIPIFCPALTNGLLDDMLRFHSFKSPGLLLDINADIRRINTFAQYTSSSKTCVIVLNGGAAKHHTMNANLMRNGADYAVYMNTAPEFDGSDRGAPPDEAISWGKIRPDATSVKVTCDPTFAFPLLMEQTFYKQCNFRDMSDRPKLDQLWAQFAKTALKSSHYGDPVALLKEMLSERADKNFTPNQQIEDEFIRPKTACTIFLAFTSNMISSGTRGSIRSLVKQNMVDCIVATAGAIEEDLIKCLRLDNGQHADTFVASFRLSGSILRENGINRIGNLLVPNENYCRFEDWVMPILDKVREEQESKDLAWTPSKLIERLGLEVNDEKSVCYWAAKNKIPIFCPALTDGSLGDMLYFHSFKSPGLIIDIIKDSVRMDAFAQNASTYKTGAIFLGSGDAKRHAMKLTRNGTDYAVSIDTAPEFEGSVGGANPYEARSLDKIRSDAKSAKVACDATIAFPLLLAETFFSHLKKNN